MLRKAALELHSHGARVEGLQGLVPPLPPLLGLDHGSTFLDVLRLWRAVLGSEHPKVCHVCAGIAPSDGLLAWSNTQRHRARRCALRRGARRGQLATSCSERRGERRPTVKGRRRQAEAARLADEGAGRGQVEHHEDQQHRALRQRRRRQE